MQTREGLVPDLAGLPELLNVCVSGWFMLFIYFFFQEKCSSAGYSVAYTFAESPILLERGTERCYDLKYYALWGFSKQTRDSKWKLLEFFKF